VPGPEPCPARARLLRNKRPELRHIVRNSPPPLEGTKRG
jgi:hypothetical protein